MFLHSGASLHGHEYSNKPYNQPVNQNTNLLPGQSRTSLLRSAFKVPGSPSSSSSSASTVPSSTTLSSASHASTFSSPASTSSRSTATPSPASIIRSKTVSGRGSHFSRANDRSQRYSEPVVRFLDPIIVDTPTINRSLSMSNSRSPAPFRPKSHAFNEPELTSEDDDTAFSTSEAGYASDRPASLVASSNPGRRCRTPRKSTTFLFAHPAPKLSSKSHLLKHVRPTLLMQLQQISPDHRPVPVIDVYPSSLMAGNVIAPWFSKRVPRLFGINSELGLHDTILVRSEDYDSGYFGLDSDGDDEVLGQRQLLAVLSPMRRGGQFEMALDDGSVWTMTALPTGSFDFNCIDEHGFKSTARWVRRSAAKSSAAGIDSADSTTISDCKFIFSMIDTHSRRHPILATLTRSTLEILDSYTTISSSASKYPPSRACTQPPTIRDRSASDDKISTYDEDVGRPTVTNAIQPTNMKTQTTLPVEAALKKFISISAILVSMQCGWTQSQATSLCTVTGTNGNTETPKNGKAVISNARDQLAVDASNVSDDTSSRGRRLSIRRNTRSATLTSTDLPSREWSPTVSSRSRTCTRDLSPRADSTGTAYIQHRKQIQSPESGDPGSSLACVADRRRSRGFSRVSGDYNFMTLPKFQPPPPSSEVAPMTVATPPEISPESSLKYAPVVSKQATTTDSVSTPLSARSEHSSRQSWTAQSLPRSKRSVSAIYATNPLAGQHAGYFDATSQEQQAAISVGGQIDSTRPGMHHDTSTNWQRRPRSVVERDSNASAKWKRLGSWFKRLSGSSNNNDNMASDH